MTTNISKRKNLNSLSILVFIVDAYCYSTDLCMYW